jgi:hypothetical protein
VSSKSQIRAWRGGRRSSPVGSRRGGAGPGSGGEVARSLGERRTEREGADARRGGARKPGRSRRPPGQSAEDGPGGGAAGLEEVQEEKCGREDGGARSGWDGEASPPPRECARAAASCKMQQLLRLLLETLQCASDLHFADGDAHTTSAGDSLKRIHSSHLHYFSTELNTLCQLFSIY